MGDQEMQQRSVEYLALSSSSLSGVKATVLEMMPQFTERESIVEKTLSKSQGETSAMPATSARASATSDGGCGCDDSESRRDAPSLPIPATTSTQPNLLGDIDGDLAGGCKMQPPVSDVSPSTDLFVVGASTSDTGGDSYPDMLGLMSTVPAS